MNIKQIQHFKHYQVTENGDVLYKGNAVKQQSDTEGYRKVSIGGKVFRVHRLVAQAFIENPQSKPFVNHKNNKKDDNRVSNLEWVTPRENSMLAAKDGLIKGGCRPTPIVVENIATGQSKEFTTQAEAARFLGISDSEVNKALRKKRVSSHGYYFRYAQREAV